MFIKVTKKDLDQFNYLTNDIKMLVPYVMIKVAHQIYGEDNEVTISIEQMWNLVTKGKRKLRKAQRENLLDWFYWFTDNEDITFEDDYTFNVDTYDDTYIRLDMKYIVSIFTNYRFDNIDVALAITLRVISHMNGEYIGLSKIDLIKQLEHLENQYIEDSVFHINKPSTWFLRYTMKDWENMARNIVAFPNIEDLLKTRYDSDKAVMDKPFIYEDNFNNHLKKLEELGIVCKVQTNYGERKNKIVFCLVEHKEVVEQLYKRYNELVAYSRKHKTEEVEEPTQPITNAKARRNRW
jgi:hypothetical protein